MSVKELRDNLHLEIGKVVFGQLDVIDFSLAALLSSSHVILEGAPGLAKTLLIKTVAASLDFECRRIQMTPDLLPNDIIGSSIYREDTRSFEFSKGPDRKSVV